MRSPLLATRAGVPSEAAGKDLVLSGVADGARAGVSSEGSFASRREADGVGVDTDAATVFCGMTGGAITFGVATDTGHQVTPCLHAVVCAVLGAVHESARVAVNPSAPRRRVGRTGPTDTRTQVARLAEGFMLMARGAAIGVLFGLHGMHREKVVRMNFTRAHARVVA